MQGTIRVILIVLVLAVAAYLGYSHFQRKAGEKAKRKAEQERIWESDRTAISKMVSKFDAIDDWKRKLRERNTGTFSGGRILTMVENLWLTDKPILFKGRIKDIVPLHQNICLIRLEEQTDLSEETKLALFLECPKTMIDSLLSAYPAAKKNSAKVAVIAKIKKIETRSGHTENVWVWVGIGIGQCLDILYRDERTLEDDE